MPSASKRRQGPGPLALVGGDEFHPGNEQQDDVLLAAAGGGPAFVLATAAARQRPDLAVRNAQAWFRTLGLEVGELPAIRRSDVTSPANADLARTGRLSYLVGGDPGLVPKTLADTPLWGGGRGGVARILRPTSRLGGAGAAK